MARKKKIITLVLTLQEADGLAHAASNIIGACSESERRDFFGNARKAGYADAGYEKLRMAANRARDGAAPKPEV
jgi:hypothetical protein